MMVHKINMVYGRPTFNIGLPYTFKIKVIMEMTKNREGKKLKRPL